MRQTLEFLKDRPIYDFLRLVDYDEEKYPVDSISVYNFEQDEYYPKIDFLEAFGDFSKDGVLFYHIYKGLWNHTVSNEWNQRSGKSDWHNASREVRALRKVALNRKLVHISFNFSGEGKHVATIKSPYLLDVLDNEIYLIMKDHMERFPITELKSGDKSGYIHEYCKNLYPFFLYLKKYIFHSETDKYIREFIVKFLSFVNDRPRIPDEIPVTTDRINESKLKKLFLSQENPNIKLNISGL